MSNLCFERLEKLLGMLGSEHPGERAAAGLKATELLRQHKLTWRDVLRLPEPSAVQQPTAPPHPTRPVWDRNDDRANVRTLLDAYDSDLTEWEQGFLNSLARQRRELTRKQRDKLAAIWDRLEP